jgi:serine/threonine-protein kinase
MSSDPARTSLLRDRLSAALAGRYESLREIGSGGMAVVYSARDVRHARDVALKVLRDDVAQAIGTERFLSEIQFAAKLTHPHILPLYETGSPCDGRQRGSDQSLQHASGHSRAEVRAPLEEPRDVGQILLTLARAPGLVLDCPDLSLENVLDRGDRQL